MKILVLGVQRVNHEEEMAEFESVAASVCVMALTGSQRVPSDAERDVRNSGEADPSQSGSGDTQPRDSLRVFIGISEKMSSESAQNRGLNLEQDV